MTDDTNAAVNRPAVEVYPAPPLKAVAIEIRFRRTLDAVARFGDFQRRHPEFPLARLADDEDADDDEMVLMLESGKDRGVAISPTMLSLITYAYGEGFAGFYKWAAPLIDDALRVLDLARFTTVVYRYENVIEGSLSVEEVLRVNIPRPKPATLGQDLFVGWDTDFPHGTVSAQAWTAPSKDKDKAHLHLHLDITASCRGPINRDDLSGAIDQAHSMGRLVFEELITPEFRERLRRGKP